MPRTKANSGDKPIAGTGCGCAIGPPNTSSGNTPKVSMTVGRPNGVNRYRTVTLYEPCENEPIGHTWFIMGNGQSIGSKRRDPSIRTSIAKPFTEMAGLLAPPGTPSHIPVVRRRWTTCPDCATSGSRVGGPTKASAGHASAAAAMRRASSRWFISGLQCLHMQAHGTPTDERRSAFRQVPCFSPDSSAPSPA